MEIGIQEIVAAVFGTGTIGTVIGLVKTGHLRVGLGKNNGKKPAPVAPVAPVVVENPQIKAVDKRVDRLSDVVQYASTCDARYNDLKGDTTQIRDDVKDILKELRK